MSFSSVELLVVLSFLAGAVHFFSPDHWVPSAVLAWQRNWGFVRSFGFSIRLTFFHVGSAFVLYWLFQGFLLQIPQDRLLASAVLLIALGGVIRTLRFSRVNDVLRFGPSPSGWGIYAVLSLLGPAESLVPILMKASQLGAGYLLPVGAFGMGSFLSSWLLLLIGRRVWDRPLLLPLGVQLANKRISVMPAALSVIAGLALLFRA